MKTYELYVSKLNPENPRLWQAPKNQIGWDDTVWYCDKLGKNKVQQLMPDLIKDAKLANKTLTNHCIRSTCITVLDKKGFQAKDIMAVSGHKKEESIKSYASIVPKEKKRDMSNALAGALTKVQPTKKQKTETITGPLMQNPTPANNVFDMSFKRITGIKS